MGTVRANGPSQLASSLAVISFFFFVSSQLLEKEEREKEERGLPRGMAKRMRAKRGDDGDSSIVEEDLIRQILESMGVTAYEEAVVAQLVEVMHRRWLATLIPKLEIFLTLLYIPIDRKIGYTEVLLRDAYDYAQHAGRKVGRNVCERTSFLFN